MRTFTIRTIIPERNCDICDRILKLMDRYTIIQVQPFVYKRVCVKCLEDFLKVYGKP